MAAVLKKWREAATLILVATNTTKHIKFTPVTSSRDRSGGDNLDVLMLKRSSKSSFMPNVYVFPGGVADNADFSRDWLDIFHAVGKETTSELFHFVTKGTPACPIFSRVRDDIFSAIPSEIAMRICAIRETFEESGVLLVRPISTLNKYEASFGSRGPMWGSICTDPSVIDHWRGIVDKDATKFVMMCKELDVVPDVWSLYEWSNWLTPTTEQPRRFDTAFFVCCIPDKVPVTEDKGETVHSQWGTPAQILYEYQMNRASLFPPQLYTLSVLANFLNVEELHQFIFDRLPWRSERWQPVAVVCDDGFIMVLPGDDLYPDTVDVYGEDEVKLRVSATMKEQRSNTKNHHRAEVHLSASGKPKYHLFSNIDYGDRRLTPIKTDDLAVLTGTHLSDSKL